MAKALWFVAPGQVEIREFELPKPGPDEVLLRGLYSAVSSGTERHLVAGTAPTPFDPSLDVEGAPVYPRRYGYAWVGEVQRDQAFAAGTRVFALASHADAHVLGRGQVRPLPDDLPPLRATLAASMETAVTAVWDGHIGLGDNVLVLGGGTVGALCAELSRRAGAARVCVVEPNDARREAMSELRLEEILRPEELDTETRFDVVLEATGNPAVLDTAIERTAREGRVVVVSFYGQRVAPLSLGQRFHRERLSLVSSQVSTIPLHKRAHFDMARRFRLVLDLLMNSRLDVLFEPPIAFANAPLAYERLVSVKDAPKQLAFVYESEL